MDYKICLKHDIKLYEDGNGGFEGYGSIFSNFDRVQEAVVPGAFTNVDDFVKNGFIAIGHDWSGLPIGTIVEAKQDSIGLWIKVEFHSTRKAQDARAVITERLARGKFVGLSIGYEVNESEYVAEGRLLKALTLFEVSLVTVPANDRAGILAAKDSSPTNMSLDEQSSLMLAKTKDYCTRLIDLHNLRQKDGRGLSESRRAELLELKQVIDDCLTATTPYLDSAIVRSHYAKYLALCSPTLKEKTSEQI